MKKSLIRVAMTVVLLVCLAVIVPVQSQAATKSDIKKYTMVFDANYYSTTYPDVVAAYGNDYNKLLAHYINNGIAEGRNASSNFNVQAYRDNNADLNTAYGDNWACYHEHYAVYGKAENRVALPGKNKNQNKQTSKQQTKTVAGGEVIGTYTTEYDATIPRATNVVVAASRINGVVVKPGGKFSFSKTVLPRTSANGYVSAPVIVGGKYVDGIGGGICQVSSTLYAAMVNAGLPATERHSHSLESPYIAKGLDASIAANSKDLRFTNTFKYSIIINATADNGTLTVTISKY